MSLIIVGILFSLLTNEVLASSLNCKDNFSDQRTCNWNLESNNNKPNRWNISNNQLTGQASFFETEEINFFLTGSDEEKDYTIEADVNGLEGVDKTIVGRFTSRDHYYILNLRSKFGAEGNDLNLVKICCQGHRKNLRSIPLPNENNNWYKLSLNFSGTKIKAYVNNELKIDYDDYSSVELPLAEGKAGLAAWGGNFGGANPQTKILFTNISIQQFPKQNATPEIYILIPGLGASWNPLSIASCNLLNIGDWTIAPYATIYDRLNKTLENAGLKTGEDYYIYAYDWRQPLVQQADSFKNYLDKIMAKKAKNTKINIISHSLGGLVIRSFLASYPNDYLFNHILTLGTPHYGTPIVYALWEGGQINTNDKYINIAANALLNHCKNVLIDQDPIEVIHYIAPSLKDLLPIYPFLEDQNGELLPTSSLVEKNDWLLQTPQNTNYGSWTTISGNDHDTLKTIVVAPASNEETINNQWIDGKPSGYKFSKEGDGTILLQSAILPNAQNTQILPDLNHGELVYSDLGITAILKSLGLTDTPLAKQEKESAISIKSVPLNLDILQKPFEWKRYKLKILN